MVTVNDIYNYLDREYPFDTQEEWDNSGLLCGDGNSEVKTCLVTLDITCETVKCAKELSAELIVSHHPVIFKPQKSFTVGSAAYEAVRNGISIISAHTNFDKAKDGTSYLMAKKLGIKTVYDKDKLFLSGELEHVHTVEEMAGFVSSLLSTDARCSLPEKRVKKVALCAGAGGDELEAAANDGAELFITGELKYHEILDAAAMGLAIITAGHFETEDPAMETLAARLGKEFPQTVFVKNSPAPPILTVSR